MGIWDNYLSKLNERQRFVVIETLSIAKEFSPESTEEMPYGVPGLKLNGKPLIAVAAHKEHFGIYPFSPKVIEAVKPNLGDRGTAKGTIRFNYDDQPSTKLIKQLIELRTEELSTVR